MANNQNKVNALLKEKQSESQILANAIKRQDAALAKEDYRTYYLEQLFIHKLENQHRSEKGKILAQAYDEIALDFALKMPTPPTAKITKKDIERGREQEKNDAKWKENDRKAVRKFWQERGKYFTDAQIEKQVDKRFAQAKEMYNKAQKRPQSASLPQTKYQNFFQNQPVNQQNTQPNQNTKVDDRRLNALQRRNELQQKHYAQQLAQQKANNQERIESWSQKFAQNLSRSNGQASISTSASLNYSQPLARSQSAQQLQTGGYPILNNLPRIQNFSQTFNQQPLARSQSQTSLYPIFDDIKPQQQLTQSQSQITSNPYAEILKQNSTQNLSRSNSQSSINTQSQTSLYPSLHNQNFKPTLSSKTEMRPSTVSPTNKGGFGYPSL